MGISDLCLPSSSLSWMDRSSHTPPRQRTPEEDQAEKERKASAQAHDSMLRAGARAHTSMLRENAEREARARAEREKAVVCDWCKQTYANVGSLVRHQARSKRCQRLSRPTNS